MTFQEFRDSLHRGVWNNSNDAQSANLRQLWKLLFPKDYTIELLSQELDDATGEIARLTASLNAAREALERISKDTYCMGPGCPFCEREDIDGMEHPFSATAKVAQQALAQIGKITCQMQLSQYH